MKIKTMFLSLLLCVCSLCGVFALVGCGQAGIEDLKSNFQQIDEIYSENVEVFRDDTIGGVPSSYFVSFGTNVANRIAEKEDGFVQLDDYYNVMFAISCNYIKNNKDFILARSDENLNNNSKDALDNLNKCASAYLGALREFLEERNKFVTYFDTNPAPSAGVSADVIQEQNENYLRIFKKSFGNLVSKNTELSLALAKTVETTELFELINQGENPNVQDSKILKEYVAVKLLPIFVEFRLTETDNKFNYNNPHIANGSAKIRVDANLAKLDTLFEKYRKNIVVREDVKELANSAAVTNFLSEIDNFFIASEDYFTSLREFDIQRVALSFDNNLEEYKKSNKLAEEFLLKIEQFLNVTLPDFMETVENTLL